MRSLGTYKGLCGTFLIISIAFWISCIILLMLETSVPRFTQISNTVYTSLSYFEFVSNSIALVTLIRPSPIAQLVKNPPAMQETLVCFLGQEDHLEKR